MNILNSTNDLPEIKFCLFLCDFVILDKIIELTFWGQFHNDKDIIGGVEDLIQFDDVGVVDKLENFDLSFDFGYHVFVFHFFFVDYFDGNPDACEVMTGFYLDDKKRYIWLWRIHQNQWSCQECSDQCVLIPFIDFVFGFDKFKTLNQNVIMILAQNCIKANLLMFFWTMII